MKRKFKLLQRYKHQTHPYTRHKSLMFANNTVLTCLTNKNMTIHWVLCQKTTYMYLFNCTETDRTNRHRAYLPSVHIFNWLKMQICAIRWYRSMNESAPMNVWFRCRCRRCGGWLQLEFCECTQTYSSHTLRPSKDIQNKSVRQTCEKEIEFSVGTILICFCLVGRYRRASTVYYMYICV